MPSIFLFAGFIKCSVKLPKPFRAKCKKSQKQSKAHGVDAMSAKGDEKVMTTVLSGNLTDSTDSMYSRSSCGDSIMTMETASPFQKGTRVVSHDNLGGAVELLPAKTFYFMPMQEECADLQCTTSEEDWGYFVDTF